jgi:hypothetical protein
VFAELLRAGGTPHETGQGFAAAVNCPSASHVISNVFGPSAEHVNVNPVFVVYVIFCGNTTGSSLLRVVFATDGARPHGTASQLIVSDHCPSA